MKKIENERCFKIPYHANLFPSATQVAKAGGRPGGQSVVSRLEARLLHRVRIRVDRFR